jgi:oxygen-dependent protoporphyrinogen oxidase
MVALNAFIGGSRQPELYDLDQDALLNIVIKEVKSTMQISGNPVYLHTTRWKQSIPQYTIGYQSKMDVLHQFEESSPGLFLAGNYRGGISVGDCLKSAHEMVERIMSQHAAILNNA